MWALARLRLLPAASAASSSAGARAISVSAPLRDLREFLEQPSGDAATYGAPARRARGPRRSPGSPPRRPAAR
jgi:hypothetical protein